MTFANHLDELRSRLLKALAAVGVTLVVGMSLMDPLVELCVQPHLRAMALIGVPREESKFLAGSYPGPFFVQLKLAFIFALFTASPIVAYQLWAFVSAGLYPKERRHVTRFAVPSFILFISGCAFGYFVLIPYGLWGMAQMTSREFISLQFVFSDYLSLVMLMTIIMGAIFELPLVMMFLSVVGLVQPATYSKWRRLAIVLIFVVAAVLTPPDVFTQILMAIPMLLLYELGIVLARLGARSRGEAPAHG